MLQRFEFVMQIAEPAAAGDRFVQHGTARHFLDILAEIADRQLLRYGNFAFVRRFFADDHAEQRCFAGAVRTDEADLFARIELKRCVDEENLAAILLADVRKRNHESSIKFLVELKVRGAPFSGSINARRRAISCIGESPSRGSLIVG